MRKRLLARFAGRGTLVQPKALELLLEQPDPEGSAELVLSGVPEDQLLLTVEDVRRALDGVRGTDGPPERPGQTEPLAAGPPGPSASQPPSPLVLEPQSPVAPEPVKPSTAQSVRTIPTSAKGLRVLKDVTGRSTCEGHLEDFVRYFNDRMARLKRMLRNRRELIGAVPVGAIKARRHDREVKTIAMVTEVRRTPNGRIIADIEDETGSFRILLPAEDRPPVNLMRDEVIGIVGKLSNEGDIIWVQNVVRPDLPLSREPRRAQDPICAAFISDIHLGSKTFLEDEWRRMVSWLNGREKRHQDYARRIEHLVISGDVVDGIGIYPDQEEDLAIRDVYRQYQVLAEMLKEVPDRIRILMLPGNHDAVRPAEPQPTFPPEITKLFDSNIDFVGNPCHFQLEGVEVLAYHGMSIADFTSTIPNLSFNTPLEVMKEMLRRRHLAPVFGDKTPLAPENRDWMVIDSIPDIFVTGHVHGAGIENYRGVVLINSSTWQSQTDYQRMMNFQPQPCRVAMVDLRSLEWRTVSFDGQQ